MPYTLTMIKTNLTLFSQAEYEMLHLGKLMACVSMAGGILQSCEFDESQRFFRITVLGVTFKELKECAIGLDIVKGKD